MSSEFDQPGDIQDDDTWLVDLRGALIAMRANFAAARAAIEATDDPQYAFQLATMFRDKLDELVGSAAELRAQMVERIWESEQLSLAALAKRIGVSKSRANQFIETARAAKNEEEKS